MWKIFNRKMVRVSSLTNRSVTEWTSDSPTPTLSLPLKRREVVLFFLLKGEITILLPLQGGQEGDGDWPKQYNYVFSIMASFARGCVPIMGKQAYVCYHIIIRIRKICQSVMPDLRSLPRT